jgi:YaiO family outer membrane protein
MDEGRYMKKTHILSLLALLILVPIALSAQETFPQRSMEASLSYDYLTPEDEYEDWKSAEAKLYYRMNPRNTVMFGSGVSIRDVSLGWVQTALYRDWQPRFSTYTSLTAATESQWMGKVRFDNDLNFKIGADYRYIVSAGQTLVHYNEDKIDYLLSIGGMLYLPHLIIEARHYFNRSDPGKVWSDSDRLSVGFGTRGKYWTTVVGTIGGQKYMGLDNLGVVDRDVSSISVLQEIWLNPSGGIKFGAGYLTVKDGYDKYNANVGCFWQLH